MHILNDSVRDFYSFKHRLYIVALNQSRELILSRYVLLRYMNTIYVYCDARLIFKKCR